MYRCAIAVIYSSPPSPVDAVGSRSCHLVFKLKDGFASVGSGRVRCECGCWNTTISCGWRGRRIDAIAIWHRANVHLKFKMRCLQVRCLKGGGFWHSGPMHVPFQHRAPVSCTVCLFELNCSAVWFINGFLWGFSFDWMPDACNLRGREEYVGCAIFHGKRYETSSIVLRRSSKIRKPIIFTITLDHFKAVWFESCFISGYMIICHKIESKHHTEQKYSPQIFVFSIPPVL